MNNILDDFDTEETLSDVQIFRDIWFSPRKVFKFIQANKYEKFMIPILVLAGISSSLDRAVSDQLGDRMTTATILGTVLLTGAFFGWISYYIYAAMISWIGKFMGGSQDTKSLFRVITYASLPIVVSVLLIIPQLIVFGEDLFTSELVNEILELSVKSIVFYAATLLEFIFMIWSFVLWTIGVSEVQGFSNGKAFLNIIMPLVLIVVLAVIVFVLIDLTAG